MYQSGIAIPGWDWAVPKRKRPKNVKHKIPRRTPSIVIPGREVVYVTPDKTTCAECTCFPPDPYIWKKKLNPCLKSPLTLYELAAVVVNALPLPDAFKWSITDVAQWMENELGLPEYKECILDNNINGMRLLFLEDPSKLQTMNIRNFEHIKLITSKVREIFSTEFVKFVRNLTLPPRKPLTHCTWFKSRTGPTWGIRQLWDRCTVLRWMKILMPEPVRMDHWDIVWYQKPDFPCVKFARIKKPPTQVYIPRYRIILGDCREYLTPRKYKIQTDITESKQYIWMEHPPREKPKKKKKTEFKIARKSIMDTKEISLTGLTGKEFILAKRKMGKPKFLS